VSGGREREREREREKREATHVDTLIVSVFELSDTLLMIWDHPFRSGTVLHTSKDEFGYLRHCVSVSSCRIVTG